MKRYKNIKISGIRQKSVISILKKVPEIDLINVKDIYVKWVEDYPIDEGGWFSKMIGDKPVYRGAYYPAGKRIVVYYKKGKWRRSIFTLFHEIKHSQYGWEDSHGGLFFPQILKEVRADFYARRMMKEMGYSIKGWLEWTLE